MILAIDTSGSFASVAVGDESCVLAQRCGSSGQNHSEELEGILRTLLDERRLQFSDLKSIVLGKGPGSFTGLRIGYAIAQGIALVRSLPVYQIPSALGISATRVLAPAGKGLVFESLRKAASDPFVRCSMRVSAEILPPDNDTRGLQIIPEFPSLILNTECVAAGLLSLFYIHPKLFNSTTDLSILEPDYVRSVAAKSITERTVSASKREVSR